MIPLSAVKFSDGEPICLKLDKKAIKALPAVRV